MKKILAIILTLVMLFSMSAMVVPVSAEAGEALKAAPVLDGVINEGEYTYSVTTKVDDLSAGANSEVQGEEVVEYFAYNSQFVYYGIKFTQASDNRACWPQYKINNSFWVFTNDTTKLDINDFHSRHSYQARYQTAGNTTTQGAGADAGTLPEVGIDTFVTATKDANNVKTYEFKWTRAYFARYAGCASEDVRVIPYWTFFHASTSTAHKMTAADMEKVTAVGISGVRDLAENGNMYHYMVLGEQPATITDKYEQLANDLGLAYYIGGPVADEADYVAADWKKLSEDAGLTINVPLVLKAPVFDGVISEGEYPATRVTLKSELPHGSTAGEISEMESILEGFGHDEDYIYYAISFKQTTLNRACWPQFRVDNSFDVYRSTYSNRAKYQSRYSEDGEGNVVSYVNGVDAQAGYKGITNDMNGEEVSFNATLDKDTGVKTYEYKFSKAYLAACNNVEKSDIKVLPYLVSFHAAATLCGNISENEAAALKAAGATKVPAPGDSGTYLFMSLDYTAIEDVIETETQATASVRISAQNPGLRFKSAVNTADLADLVTKFGAENVKVGTLIAPADKVGAKALDHKFGTAGVDYLDVAADIANPFGTNGENTVFAGSITNIKAKNLERDFVAVGYIAYNDGEGWSYIYSAAKAEKNVAEIALAAYTDVTLEEADGYTNEIVGEGDALKGAYSPYTAAQRVILNALIVDKSAADNYAADIFAK